MSSPKQDYSEILDVVDANLYVVHEDNGTRRIDFIDAIEYANEPLDREIVRDYLESGKKSSSMMRAVEDNKANEKIQEMKREYFDHIDKFHYELELICENGKSRILKGEPRTDLDFKTGVFPSIIPFQYEDESSEQVIFREMRPYDKEFEKFIAKDTEFTGKTGYDWNFAQKVGTSNYNPKEKPDNFTHIPEPLDFLALNGYGGLNRKSKEEDFPPISSPYWAILDVDAKTDKIIGVRPHYDEIWDAGVSKTEARKLGEWLGVNRGIGRFVHDMDDEFFHAHHAGENFVGFYDNEFPIAVGADRAFEGDIWNEFYNNFVDMADDDEIWIEKNLRDEIREAEREIDELIKDQGLSYTEHIPRNVEERMIPEELKANRII